MPTMIRLAKRPAVCGVLATTMLLAAGCERGSGGRPLDTTTIAGRWIELADQSAVNPRMPGATGRKQELRYLVINQDNTFEFGLADSSGQPLEGSGKIQGTWEISGNEVIFSVTGSTFPSGDERNDWGPELSFGPKNTNIPKRGLTEVLPITDKTGMVINYVRAD